MDCPVEPEEVEREVGSEEDCLMRQDGGPEEDCLMRQGAGPEEDHAAERGAGPEEVRPVTREQGAGEDVPVDQERLSHWDMEPVPDGFVTSKSMQSPLCMLVCNPPTLPHTTGIQVSDRWLLVAV